MSRWSYYSPLLLGIVLMFAMAEAFFDQDFAKNLSDAARWTALALAAVGLGLVLQLLMVGGQGAFAQVLPVPRGRSIRGAAATTAGALLLAAGGLALVAGLIYNEETAAAAYALGAAGLACLAAALGIYIWCWPTAARDFPAD